jgi:hypothetical protein
LADPVCVKARGDDKSARRIKELRVDRRMMAQSGGPGNSLPGALARIVHGTVRAPQLRRSG